MFLSVVVVLAMATRPGSSGLRPGTATRLKTGSTASQGTATRLTTAMRPPTKSGAVLGQALNVSLSIVK